MGADHLYYRILGVNVAVHCPTADLRALLQAQWEHMANRDLRADLTYAVSRNDETSAISIMRPGRPPQLTPDEGQFLYELDGDVTIELQQRRSDLYFLHAAVVEIDHSAHLFVAESGGGKSTTVWGLLHHGWGYLSDELAPIDLSTMQVHAYPRALCLKRRPRPPYTLPPETVQTPRTLHVPVRHLPQVSTLASCPLASIYFVKYSPTASAPSIGPISVGEASARLYANALNQLAHANAGLEAVARIAKNAPGFALESADLAATCALVCSHSSLSRP